MSSTMAVEVAHCVCREKKKAHIVGLVVCYPDVSLQPDISQFSGTAPIPVTATFLRHPWLLHSNLHLNRNTFHWSERIEYASLWP